MITTLLRILSAARDPLREIDPSDPAHGTGVSASDPPSSSAPSRRGQATLPIIESCTDGVGIVGLRDRRLGGNAEETSRREVPLGVHTSIVFVGAGRERGTIDCN